MGLEYNKIQIVMLQLRLIKTYKLNDKIKNTQLFHVISIDKVELTKSLNPG